MSKKQTTKPLNNAAANDFVQKLSGRLTQARKEIIFALAKHKWFWATEPALQAELALLPQEGKENHDGFLEDLAARPDDIGGVQVLRLKSLARGNFAVIPVFEVRNTAKGHEYSYEYVSWRYGKISGAKGLVFVRPDTNAAPTHFIVLVGEKFAPAEKLYDTIGGFIDLGIEGVQTLTDRILLEVKQELGVDDLEVDEVMDLGNLYTDPGMTNAKPNIFIAFISTKQAERVPSTPVNPDIWELEAGALLVPMTQLKEVVQRTADPFFCSVLLKAAVSEQTSEAFRKSVLKALI